MRRNLIKSVLAVGDYLLMVTALVVMLVLRYEAELIQLQFIQHIKPFAIVFVAWITVFYILDLYNINAPFNHRYFVYAMVVNVALAAGFYYTFPGLSISPKRNLLIIVLTYIVFFYAWRFLANRVIDIRGTKRGVVIIGSDQHSLELARSIHEKSREGFGVSAILLDDASHAPAYLEKAGITLFESIEELKHYVLEQGIGTVIISPGWYNRVYRDLYELVSRRVRFYQLTTFWEQFNETIPIYATDESWFLENLNQGAARFYAILKRILDFVAALLLTPILIPLALLTAIIIRLSSPGSALFRQIRVGRNGRLFVMYKFRSMTTDAEKDGAQWAAKNDPRITPVGRFIRATRLDEIPQLFNVLKGEMSFIGPRPERPEFVKDLSVTIPHYALRLMAKPGLTGWAQIKLGYTATEEESATKLTYDLYYVKNMSFVLDFKILLKTVLTVLTRQGR